MKAVSVILIIIGVIAAIMNFSIFSILVQKKKKMASELIVVVNLIIDGCYGLVLILVGCLNIWEVDLDETFQLSHLNCMVSKVPSSFLIFASLFLVLIVACNRYMAVKYPVRYKDVFKPKRVRFYLVGMFLVSGTLGGVDVGICLLDPQGESDFAHFYSVFWIYSKFVLVMLATVVMFLVYKLIAKQFSRSFWSPIVLPFKSCCLMTRLHRNNETVVTAVVAFTAQPSCHHTPSDQSPEEIGVAPNTLNNDNNSGSPDNITPEAVEVNQGRYQAMVQIGDLSERYICQNEQAPVPGDADPDHLELNSGSTGRQGDNTTSAPNRRQRRVKKALTLQQQKHYVTTIFFFVSVLFLAVSVPSSVSHLINLLFDNILPSSFIFNLYLLTETLYGINFVLNPYLFSFNNSYLKERRANLCRK